MQDRLFLVDCQDAVEYDLRRQSLRRHSAALDAPAAVNGEVFVLSDDDGFTWGDYFGYFADQLGARVQLLERNQPGNSVQALAPPSLSRRWYAGTRSVTYHRRPSRSPSDLHVRSVGDAGAMVRRQVSGGRRGDWQPGYARRKRLSTGQIPRLRRRRRSRWTQSPRAFAPARRSRCLDFTRPSRAAVRWS